MDRYKQGRTFCVSQATHTQRWRVQASLCVDEEVFTFIILKKGRGSSREEDFVHSQRDREKMEKAYFFEKSKNIP